MHQFENSLPKSNSMLSLKAFDGLCFDTGSGPLMIDKVLNATLDLTPHIDPRKSPKSNVEGQDVSTLDSESEYEIYSTTPDIREPPGTCLKLWAITETLSEPATLVIQERTGAIPKSPTFLNISLNL